MSCLKEACLDSNCYQKALRSWDWLSKLTKAHWKSGLVLRLVMWFIAVFPGKEQRLLSWNMARRNLKTLWEPQGLEEYRYCRKIYMTVVWLGLCALKGWLKLSLKAPCMSSSKIDSKGLYDQLLLLCFCKSVGRIKTALNAVPLVTVRVILGRKIMFQGKSQWSVVDFRL